MNRIRVSSVEDKFPFSLFSSARVSSSSSPLIRCRSIARRAATLGSMGRRKGKTISLVLRSIETVRLIDYSCVSEGRWPRVEGLD